MIRSLQNFNLKYRHFIFYLQDNFCYQLYMNQYHQ